MYYYRANSDSDSDFDDGVDYEMNRQLLLKKGDREELEKIDGTNTYVNSVNVFVGRQRTGKTYTAIKEIIRLSRNHPETHLLIYVNKDGKPNDDTFETTKKLIDVPIVYVSYDDCEDMLKEFLRYKETYNKIKDKHCERQLEPHHVKELYEHLYIDTMRRDYLHTLIMLEDATEFMRSKSANYVNDLMTKCRHIQCSFFVIVHFWKALSPNLKSNLSMIYIFGGYSRQQLNYITYQINVSETSQRLWQIYSRLREHQKLVIDSNLCQLKVF